MRGKSKSPLGSSISPKDFPFFTPDSADSKNLATRVLYVLIYSNSRGLTVVQMTLSRVIDKMVVDEGRALQPCRYRLFTHMYCIILYPYST